MAATVSDLLASGSEKEHAIRYWLEQRREILVAVSATDEIGDAVSVLAESGVGSLEASALRDRLDEKFAPWVGASRSFQSILIVEPGQGTTIFSTIATELETRKENRPYFKDGQSGAVIHGPYYSVTTSSVAFAVATPILAHDGSIAGVLVGRFDAAQTNDIMQRGVGTNRTFDAYLMNFARVLVSQPREVKDEAVLARAVYTPTAKRCLEGKAGWELSQNLAGNAAIIAYRWLPDFNLCIFTKLDAEEAFEASRRFGWSTLAAGSIALVISAMLAWLISVSIARPVSRLLGATQAIRDGDLGVSIPVSGSDEFAQLSRGFMDMAGGLKLRDEKIQEYTRNLEEGLEELRAARDFSKALVDAAPTLVVVLTPCGTIHFVNSYFERLTGYRLDEIRGKDWFQTLLPQRDQARIRAIFDGAIEGDATRDNVNVIVTRTGEERQIEWSDAVLRGENGEIASLLAIGADVTDKLLVVRRQEEERKRQKAILDAMFTFVGLFSTDGILIDANRAPLEAAGLQREDVIGKPFWNTYWWSHSIEAQQHIRTALARAAAGETVRDDFTARIGEGASIVLDCVFSPIRDATGRITGAVGSGVDITDKKQLEMDRERERTELQLAKTRLDDAQRTARVGSWNLDLVTGGLAWSDEIYRIFAIDADRFGATYDAFLDAIHPDDRDMVNKAYTDSVANREPYEIEHRVLLADGRVKWVEERCQTWYGDSGRPLRSAGTVQDITDRVEAEHRLRQSLADKETLLREIHHRVKNNLQIISSLLYFQAQKVKDAEDHAVILDGRDRLRAMMLVHEKLYQSHDLSQIYFGGYVRTLLQQLMESQAPAGGRVVTRIEAKDHTLPVEVATPCGLLMCELVTNALKHAFPDERRGEVVVGIGGDGTTMTMTVRDNGVGLPEDFDPKTTTSFGWQLIGSLLNQIDGTVAVTRDHGTVVTISFPYAGRDR